MYIAQSVRSLYLRSPRSAAPMQDGAAGAAQIEDNLGVKPDAAVDVGRSENDIRASRRCELPLSRTSSTDEAQLESGTINSVRRDLAVLTPYLRSRRHVTNAPPTAAHTRRAPETSPNTETQAAGPPRSTRASSTASRSTAAASGSASRSTSARARSSRLDRMPRSTSRSCGGPPNHQLGKCRPTTT